MNLRIVVEEQVMMKLQDLILRERVPKKIPALASQLLSVSRWHAGWYFPECVLFLAISGSSSIYSFH